MGVRGMDISNHQAGMDVERVVRENNIGFVFVLSNDGTFKNPYYRSQMDGARRGGATAVPYVYLRTNVDQTFETFRQQEPTPGPAIVDVEDGSGGRAECDGMHSRLHNAGYSTPLLYWPDWYRKKIGSPSLVGLPPLWTSWYPDYVNRGFDAGLAMLPSWVWNGYGGLPTRIVQFTSSGRLSGYGGNLDLNYFPGSRDELAALLGGDDMSQQDAENAMWALVQNADFMGAWRGQTVSHPELVVPGEIDPNTGKPATTSVQWEAQNNRKNIRDIRDGLKRLETSGVPVEARVSEADQTAIAAKVRAGLLEELAPLFDLARRLKD